MGFPESPESPFGDEPVALPINGTLDLHAFSPRDVNELVPAYLQACQEQGITQVRIIHGKGSGALRRTVRSLLDRHPQVVDYRQDDLAGSWGATIVTLRRPPS